MSTIAVIGTGNMGGPMAVNLAQAGHRILAFDIVGSKTAALAERDVIAATSHREAVEEADFVLTMLPTGKEVREVYFEEVFGVAPTDAVLVDSSTIDLETARDLHDEAGRLGYAMLDAPVSGGTPGAAAGTLTFMAGGDEKTLGFASPLLEPMSGHIIHCGDGGMGQAAKMCNNMMLGIQMASLAEGFRLARRVGLSDQKLFDVASSSSADCFSLHAFCPVPGIVETCPANNDYRPGFSTALMLKDMNLALDAAAQSGLEVEVAPVAAAIYRAFADAGHGDLDFSAIFKAAQDGVS